MTIRAGNMNNVPEVDKKITKLAADLTGHDPDGLAYVLIVTSFDERGQSLFANTSAPEEAIALMLAVLHTATRPWITGETVQMVPLG